MAAAGSSGFTAQQIWFECTCPRDQISEAGVKSTTHGRRSYGVAWLGLARRIHNVRKWGPSSLVMSRDWFDLVYKVADSDAAPKNSRSKPPLSSTLRGI